MIIINRSCRLCTCSQSVIWPKQSLPWFHTAKDCKVSNIWERIACTNGHQILLVAWRCVLRHWYVFSILARTGHQPGRCNTLLVGEVSFPFTIKCFDIIQIYSICSLYVINIWSCYCLLVSGFLHVAHVLPFLYKGGGESSYCSDTPQVWNLILTPNPIPYDVAHYWP